MGHIGGQLSAHILLGLQSGSHLVDRLGEIVQLSGAAPGVKADLVVAGGDVPGELGGPDDGGGDVPGYGQPHQGGADERDGTHHQ